jgi:hypothetical protein
VVVGGRKGAVLVLAATREPKPLSKFRTQGGSLSEINVPNRWHLIEFAHSRVIARKTAALANAASLSLATSWEPRMYCNRTATGLVQGSTKRTKEVCRIAEMSINKRNSRTH